MNYITTEKGLPSVRCAEEETPMSKQGINNNYNNYKAIARTQKPNQWSPVISLCL